ncbi:MAG: 4-(cytidine 5'-diphospho)-2-C-methyl-D-erythritol kinase [Rhodobacteraceae bacterium]|nr:4-(cytidine 5'-diphospho)-2-C-methyl-D-erythritol kinase [Paracoccaceae bacterium]
MMKVEAFAPAKINLTLHVTGQRDDDYHLLDSLVVFADIGDRLTLTPGLEMTLDVTGPQAVGVPADDRNLVWKAASGIGWTGHIHLHKELPNGAGLGGGSSDAACVLRASGHKISEDFPLSLGADVPICVLGKAARMQGIGEQITSVTLPSLPALLVNPGIAVPTGPVFKALQCRDNPQMPECIPEFASAEECAVWLEDQRNDLETPAIAVAPEIELVLRELGQTRESLLTRMSGSGATCFALYPTMKAAHMAAYEIEAAHPGWWCRVTQLT